MLWYDNDPRTALTVKVGRAADYYRLKYGLVPDLCFVHPSMLIGHPQPIEASIEKVEVRSNRTIPPGHFWIGQEEKNQAVL